jgi:hypothetical protein
MKSENVRLKKTDFVVALFKTVVAPNENLPNILRTKTISCG